jgi:sugar lactone lactonase YvrE
MRDLRRWFVLAIGVLGLVDGAMEPAYADLLLDTDTRGDNAVEQVASNGAASFLKSVAVPSGLAVDSAGNLYVNSFSANAVLKIAPDGTLSTFASGVASPEGLTIDSAGNLYVTDNRFDAAGLGAITKITPGGAKSTFVSGLTSVGSDAIDSNGNVYLVDFTNKSVLEYNSGGTLLRTLASGLNSPTGLAIDASNNVYVSNDANGTIQKITQAGGVSLFTSGLSTPFGLAFDAAGFLYSADFGDGTIQRITSSGVASPFVTGLNQPSYVVAAAVPEPSSLMLASVGLLSLGFIAGARRALHRRGS